MSKYIDVEAFREEMDNHFPFDKYTQDHEPLLDLAKSRIIRLLAKFPSADVEPVRHGQWIREYVESDNSSDGCFKIRWAECSGCGTRVIGLPNYCPNCGAKMDEEEQEHDN